MTMRIQRDLRVLLCILPKGEGLEILETLHQEGIYRADMHTARTRVEPEAGGLLGWIEKDVLTLVAPREDADRLFERIYRMADVGASAGAVLYMARVSRATPFTLPPDLPAEERAS